MISLAILPTLLPLFATANSIIAPPRSFGTWTPLPNITHFQRQEHSTVALSNSIYIVGGIAPTDSNSTVDPNSPDPTTNIVQSYSLLTGHWKDEAPLRKPMNHPNTAMVDGKIYVLGGLGIGPGQWPNWQAVGDCYVYCPVKKSWEAIGQMPNGTERGASAVGVYGSKVYVAGGLAYLGITGVKTLSVSSVYDTKSGVWTTLPDLPEGRDHAGAAIVGNTFYILGGRINGNGVGMRDTVFTLDLTSRSPVWKLRASRMPTRRGGLSAATIGDAIYTFGGEGNEEVETGVFNVTEAYDTRRDVWTKLKEMRVPRHGTSAASIGKGVYIPGGGVHQDLGATGEFDIFRP